MNLFRAILNWLFAFHTKRKRSVSRGETSFINWIKLGTSKGTIEIGNNAIIHCRVDFDSPIGLVTIGDRSYIGASHLVCHSRIEIEEDVIISWGVTIVDHNSHSIDWSQRKDDIKKWSQGIKDWEGVGRKPVKIEKRAWLGFGVSVLKGVTIGEGSVVAARSVVTKNVPPYTVVAGNPAKVVKHINQNEQL